jgi:hypothetical protein
VPACISNGKSLSARLLNRPHRTPELAAELNFHLTEFQTGRLGRLDELLEPGRQAVVAGEVVEYISHELGVARLAEGGAALFHLEQAWEVAAATGVWAPHRVAMTRPLARGYLPLGAAVQLVVRRLPASGPSRLRWQALAVWCPAACRQGEQAGHLVVGGMYSRRGLQDGQLPPAYITRYSSIEARAGLIRQLDKQFDAFKRLSRLELKAIQPVPVLLNLLPEEWEAKVVKLVDQEHGVVQISSRAQHGTDMSGDLKLKVTKMFAMFHIEDVFSATGEPYRCGPTDTMAHLQGCCVDLTARSVASDASTTRAGLFQIATSQLLLSQLYEHVCCPVLQAICVFVKPEPGAAPCLAQAPRPTYLRPAPESLHRDEPATAFHLSFLLHCRLDAKALGFFAATNQARLQKVVNNGLAMAHFNQQRKNMSTDRAEQQQLVEAMVALDPCESRRLTYGQWVLPPPPPVMPAMPPTLPSARVTVQLLHQQGLDTREGVLRLELPTPSGHRVVTHAFFDLSCYKFNLKFEARVRDLVGLLPLHSQPPLHAHLLLADADSPVPYVATAVWQSAHWPAGHRAPVGSTASADPIFLQKYRRLVTPITTPSVKQLSSLSASLPAPIPAATARPAARLLWAQQELIRGRLGKVTSIIDGSYGVAVVNTRVRGGATGPEDHRAIVLFDTCDVWLGLQTAQQLDLTLAQCLAEGDYVRVKAIMVPESENRKNIRYLATCLVAGKDRARVRRMALPDMDLLESLDQIHPSKINNFYAVVSAVCHNIPGDAEEECRGVSSDEESDSEVQEPEVAVRRPEPTGHRPAVPPGQDRQVARERALAKAMVGPGSLDQYEKEMEMKKLAKANECLQSRRKLAYDKVAREALLVELKLKNQLLWRCRECDITCGQAGMEKHVGLKAHWDRVLANYIKQLDQEAAR